jgi:hypothetical protein
MAAKESREDWHYLLESSMTGKGAGDSVWGSFPNPILQEKHPSK